MSARRRHWLTRIYPPSWRARYGEEMDELLRHHCGWRDVVDVARAALIERLFYSRASGNKTMQTYPRSIAALGRKPSAIAPIIMSLCALGVVLAAIAVVGTKRQPDEGAAGHVWQLLMAGQLPILGWFALHWLKRDVWAGLTIIGLQAAAFAAAVLPVWLLGL